MLDLLFSYMFSILIPTVSGVVQKKNYILHLFMLLRHWGVQVYVIWSLPTNLLTCLQKGFQCFKLTCILSSLFNNNRVLGSKLSTNTVASTTKMLSLATKTFPAVSSLVVIFLLDKIHTDFFSIIFWQHIYRMNWWLNCFYLVLSWWLKISLRFYIFIVIDKYICTCMCMLL